MDPLSALMLGSTALTGISSLVGGNRNAKAADDAAKQKFAMQLTGIKNAEASGTNYNNALQGYAKAYDPYVEGGTDAFNELLALLGQRGAGEADAAMGRFTASPGYQFNMDQGIQALDRSAAARGYLNSGRQSKDLTRFGQGLASNEFGNYYNRLAGLGSTGMAATGARAGMQAQGAQGLLNANLYAAGMYGGAGDTLAQGRIGAANAQTQGINGALGALNYGVGQLGGMGGSFGGGSNPLQSILGGRTSSYANSNPMFAGALY